MWRSWRVLLLHSGLTTMRSRDHWSVARYLVQGAREDTSSALPLEEYSVSWRTGRVFNVSVPLCLELGEVALNIPTHDLAEILLQAMNREDDKVFCSWWWCALPSTSVSKLIWHRDLFGELDMGLRFSRLNVKWMKRQSSSTRLGFSSKDSWRQDQWVEKKVWNDNIKPYECNMKCKAHAEEASSTKGELEEDSRQ